MNHERVETGIERFDRLIEGGFPRGSLVLVAGEPGSGKTIFSSHYLFNGITKAKEPGVFISFAEGRRVFVTNMRRLGMDFEKYEQESKFKFLDFVTVTSEGIPDITDYMIEKIVELKAKRIVIDSFSALAQAFKEKIDARILTQVILGKIVREMGCTTLVLVEKQPGHSALRSQESVADGVILLSRSPDYFRMLTVKKMRGTRLSESSILFTLDGGFQAVQRPAPWSQGNRAGPWNPIHDSRKCFSSGSKDLDVVLEGGYARGRYIVFETEANVPIDVINLFDLPLAWNFLSQGRGVVFLPALGDDTREIKSRICPHVKPIAFSKLVRVFEHGGTPKSGGESVMLGTGESGEVLMELLNATTRRLREDTGQPVLSIVGYPALENLYEGQIDSLFRGIGAAVAHNKRVGNLTLAIARPGLRITPMALNIVDCHMQLIERNGCYFFRSVKPVPSGYYAVSREITENCPTLKLTPMM